MGKEQWPGLSQRLRQRIADLGFKNPSVFADQKHYRVTHIHKWLGDTTPSRENLERLAKDLHVSAAWLLFGDTNGVDKAPVPPTKRGRRLRCMVAALGVTATAWSPRLVDAQPVGDQVQIIDNAPSYRKRRDRFRRCVAWIVGSVWPGDAQVSGLSGSSCLA